MLTYIDGVSTKLHLWILNPEWEEAFDTVPISTGCGARCSEDPAISALGSSDRRVGNSKPASIYWGGRQSRLLETVSKAEKILKILVLTCF